MTELDHTSFDTLMADLSRHRDRGVFCFQDSGDRTPPWVFEKMDQLPPPSPSGSFYIDIEYGSMDRGKWVSDKPRKPRLHVFKLYNGYLQRSGDGGVRCSPVGDKIKVVLVSGASSKNQSSGNSLDDQLNENLRGVFG